MNQLRFWDRPWLLSLFAAILLSASFPPLNLSVLQIPALVFLFRLATLSSGNRELIFYAWPCFVLWNLFTTYWLMMATFAGGIAAILANALIMLIPLILIRHLFKSKINPVIISFLAASVWVSYEFLHHHWDLSWPWLTLGNGWANLPLLIQYISFTGVLGISFWVVFTAALFFRLTQTPGKQLAASALVSLLIFPAFSLCLFFIPDSNTGQPVEVAIVQPDSDSYQQHGGLSSADDLLEKLLTLSRSVITGDTDLVIWPENALDAPLTADHHFFETIQDSLEAWEVSLITGAALLEYYTPETVPSLARETRTGRFYNVFNTAFYLNPHRQLDVYRKGRLVPVVERFPFVEFFQKTDLFGRVNWGSLMGYGLGTEARVFDVNSASTVALICYDSVFPGWVNRFVGNGAGFLTIITNDGWWGNSSGHTQHFSYARLRAVEQQMWVARAANNGISGIISPGGAVRKKTDYGSEGAFTFTIYHRQNRTFYATYGDWLGFLSLVSAAAGFPVLALYRRKRRQPGAG